MRSLPLSYLVLDRRDLPPVTPPLDAVRVIGRPRVYKAHALVLGCEASGVDEYRVSKRNLPGLFRAAKKDTLESLQVWKREGIEVMEAQSSIPSSESAPPE